MDDTYAESVQLAFAAQTACAQAKGKAKPGGKPGGKVVHSNLTIADRKAEFAELKAKSRCLRNAASLATGPVTQHASLAARAVAPGAPQPRQRPVGAPRPLQAFAKLYTSPTQVQGEWKPTRLTSRAPPRNRISPVRVAKEYSPHRSGAQPWRASCATGSPPEGSDRIFTFGQHKGMTYERVLYTYPGYVIWCRMQKCPSAGLANFLDWVTEYFDRC